MLFCLVNGRADILAAAKKEGLDGARKRPQQGATKEDRTWGNSAVIQA